MVYNELCHKEIDWSKAMKQILITLVAVVLGSSVVTSYAAKACYKNPTCSDYGFTNSCNEIPGCIWFNDVCYNAMCTNKMKNGRNPCE